MTTRSPDEVFYTVEAMVNNGSTFVDLYPTNIIASIDRDRIPFALATIECGWISDALFAVMDPRVNPTCIYWKVQQWAYNTSGVAYVVGQLPNETAGNTTAEMWTRTVTRDAVNRTTRIELAGGESMQMDKIRLSDFPLDTGATTVTDLVWWSLLDVFSYASLTSPSISDSTAIPAGDRRYHNPPESHIDLMQPELDAIDCRLIWRWGLGGQWEIVQRLQNTGTLKLASYPTAPSDADPIVYEFTETASRDGDWADGVLIKYDMSNVGGPVTYQRSGLGVHTRGKVLTRQRAATAANGADAVVARTELRGYDFTLTARARFDVDAFHTLIVYTPGTTRTIRVRAIEWDIEASEMRIRAQSGEPVE